LRYAGGAADRGRTVRSDSLEVALLIGPWHAFG
jgi:hypothetical protein